MCEFCGNDKDIIFPFQLNKCQRCEGEPSLLVAGLGGLIALRPFIPLTWRDWKISKPRRLARALAKDRREGEGGEEGLGLGEDQGVKSGVQEERGDLTWERQRRGETFQAFAPGKLVKAFSRSKGNKDKQEMTGGTESEREEEMKCGESGEQGGNGQHGGEYNKEIAKSKERGNVHARREKVNLLKVLHIDRLNNQSKGDRRDSDSETCSSNESLDVGQERKGRWKVSGLASLAKGFSKKELEVEGKTEVKEEESKEKETGSEEEGKASRQAKENDDISDRSQTEAAEREKSGAENVEKRTLMNVLKPHRLSAVFSRGRSKAEEDRSGESDGKGEMHTEEEGQHEPAFITQTTWRGRKTRKARRENRGRKIREGTEKEGKTEGGASAETNDVDYCTERGGGQD